MVDLLVEGLKPFITREIKATNGQEPLERRLPGSRSNDIAELLRIMDIEWNSVFKRTLGRSERSFAHELRDVRNAWAHNEPFSYPDTHRALDTAARLLKSVSAKQAEEVERMAVEVQRVQFDEDKRGRTRTRGQGTLDTKVVAQAGLAKWRDVVTPHRDVASGRFAQSQFAADLQHILAGTADAEYGDAREFFARTHLTQGIKDLLANAIDRLSGSGGDPVVELQTNFGGGKTHSMIALYHAFGGMQPADLPQAETFLGEHGITELPKAQRAVLVGTALNPGEPWVKPDGTTISTFWGEMAYQLGGADGYKMVQANDENGISPGSERLTELLEKFSPSLILIDEWVAYARQTYGKSDPPGGSFESNMTFAQALTEAASRVKDCLVVASLPVSERLGTDGNTALSEADQIEVGGSAGQRVLESLRDFFQRKAAQWSPATAEESFEIVRRRLFEPLIDKEKFVSRDAVISAFGQMYSQNSADFPQQAAQGTYLRLFELSYPVHPALFKVLYEGWGSLERFQRTRGVLRLMASIIHELWESKDDGLLITPGSVPMGSRQVVEELTRYLEDNWRPVIGRDVDGAESLPLQLDRGNANFGRVSATRRVARAVYMGSAPLVRTQHRGIEDREVKLGVVQPGESPATFGDALRSLADRATYLYSDGSRYWYEIKPSIAREAQDRAQRLEAEPDKVYEEIRERLRVEQRQKGDFARVFPSPQESGDFEDSPEAGLVIIGPETAHELRDKNSAAWQKAEEFLKNHGNGPRHNRNAVVFLVADRPRLDELVRAVRMYKAWEEIKQDAAANRIEITNFQRQQVDSQIGSNSTTVDHRIKETFSILLVAVQSDPAEPIEFQEYRLSGQDGLAILASKKLLSQDQLRVQFAGTLLRMELDKVLWKNGPDHIPVKQLWSYFAQHVYLPRLKDVSVLREAVADGMSRMLWLDEGFGFADTWDEDHQRYVGLHVGPESRMVANAVENGLVVKASAVQAQLELEAAAGGESAPYGDKSGSEPSGVKEPSTPVAVKYTSFHGTKRINVDRLPVEAATIGDEIVKHLQGLVGANVEISIDIQATVPDGVPDDIVRIVTENISTLRFDEGAGFEEG